MTDWDPHIFNKVIGALLDKLPACSNVIVHALKAGMPALQKTFITCRAPSIPCPALPCFFRHWKTMIAHWIIISSRFTIMARPIISVTTWAYVITIEVIFEPAINQFERALQLNPELNCVRQWLKKTTMPLIRQANL